MRLNSQFRSLLGAFRRTAAWLRREDGISLLMVMGFVLIFSITTSAIVSEVTSNEKSAGRDDRSVTLFNLAEAALNFGIDQVNTELDPKGDLGECISPSTSCPGWARYEGLPGLNELDQPEWHAEKSAAGVWTVYARASRGSTIRELEATLERGVDPDSPPPPAWQGAYSYNAGTCIIDLSNNFMAAEDIYTNGDLCLGANVHIDDSTPGSEAKTKLYVGGDVWLQNNKAQIGDADNELLSATVIGKCYVGASKSVSNEKDCANPDQSHIYTRSFFTKITNIADPIEKPPVDLTWYERAAPRLDSPCKIPGETFPGTDNNSARDNSIPAAVSLFPSTAYSCTTPYGSTISWTPDSSSSGRLSINGVVFIDGSLLESKNSLTVVYSGRGTIYVNGTITLSGNNLKLCPTLDCSGWNPNTNLLLLVALNNTLDGLPPPPPIPDTFTIDNNAIFQGAGYAIGGFLTKNNGRIEGPVIADGLRFGNNAGYFTPLGDDGLPAGAPMNPNAWLPEEGSWRQVR